MSPYWLVLIVPFCVYVGTFLTAWTSARAYDRGYNEGYDRGHKVGFTAGTAAYAEKTWQQKAIEHSNMMHSAGWGGDAA